MAQSSSSSSTDTQRDDGARRRIVSPLVMTLGGGTLIGLVATLLYSVGVHPAWKVLASSAMFAAASMAAGGLLGLLFGVPRSLDAGQRNAGSSESASNPVFAGIGANTNLEQISDWLTKIIVGVSLTQLGTIKHGAAQLFNSMAPVLGGRPEGAAFAGGIVVYFSVLGFFVGWLYARLRLGVAMSSADALLEFSRRATKAGDPDTAQAAKEAATASISAVAPSAVAAGPSPADVAHLSDAYEHLRATLPSSPRRTAQMEDVVRQARRLTQNERYTAQDVKGLFQTGTEGRRIVAMGLMEGDVSTADFPSVLTAITQPMSAFEQYHALLVANLLVSSLSADERRQLESALTDEAVNQKWSGDSSRADLAQRILARSNDTRTANAE